MNVVPDWQQNPSQHALTALILTHNEEANIRRTLVALVDWVPQILVVDSGSTDLTLPILAGESSVKVMHREFDTFADQCNFGLAHIHSEWVFSLDADYVVTPGLATEIMNCLRSPSSFRADGYFVPFRYCVAGKPLRCTLLPPRICLYRKSLAHYQNDGHGHRVRINGNVQSLRQPILHDDRKPLGRWLVSQERYLAIEAAKLASTDSRFLSMSDRLRKHTPLSPLAALMLCLVWKGGWLDGWQGWTYALQRAYAELLLKLMLLEQRCRDAGS